MRRPALRCAVPLLLLALGGCFKSPAGNGPAKNCTQSSDCTAGNRCVAGACTPGCRADGDCPAGGLCHPDGTCGTRPACAQDTDCPATFQCQSGRCACTTDYACWTGGGGTPDRTRICVQGSCQASTACTADAQCTDGRYCGPAGVCTAPCLGDQDCGGASQVGGALTCHSGRCTSPCITDAAPPGQGGCPTEQICTGGLCSPADCKTFRDCGDPTLYCTSADHGHCKAVKSCDPSIPDTCGPSADCTHYPPDQCPPGFDCTRNVCVDLPRCFVDAQCGAGSVCELGACRAAPACAQQSDCDATHDCIGGHCVPHLCRGVSDCPTGKICTGGVCAAPSAGASVARVRLLTTIAPLEVGSTQQLTAVALDGAGNAIPVAGFTWSVSPAPRASIDTGGTLDALSAGAGVVTVGFTRPDGTQATPDHGSFVVVDAPASATARVLVVDSQTGLPISGAHVRACASGYDGGACTAPLDSITDASGTVTFAQPAGPYDLSVAEVSASRPAHDVVHLLGITGADILVPLPSNEAGEAAGYTGSIDFSKVKTQGDLRVGLAGSSIADLASFGLEDLLGQPWVSTATIPSSPFGGALPGIDGGTVKVPLTGGTVADVDAIAGVGVGVHIKDNVYALGHAGLRSGWAFAGRVDPQLFFGSFGQAFATGAIGGVLPYFGAFDHGLRATLDEPLLPEVLDQEDLDGNGVCEDRAICATGGQLLPDYAQFPGALYTPSQSQSLRVELLSPPNPDGAGQVLVMAGAQVPGTGLLPLGLSSASGGGARPGDQTLRLAPLYGGLEASSYAMLVVATSGGGGGPVDGGAPAQGSGGALSVGIARTFTLPPLVDLSAPLLPFVRGAHYDPSTRRFDPGSAWAAIAPGAQLVRVALVGSSQRAFVYARPDATGAGLFVPPSPGSNDPASEPSVQATVVALHLPPADDLDAIASLPGDNLLDLGAITLGLTRATAQ